MKNLIMFIILASMLATIIGLLVDQDRKLTMVMRYQRDMDMTVLIRMVAGSVGEVVR